MALAFQAAIRSGLAPSEFWRMTPYQLRLAFKGEAEHWRDELRARIAQAWHTANLAGAVWGGDFPPLSDYADRVSPDPDAPPPDPADPEAMLAALKMRFPEQQAVG